MSFSTEAKDELALFLKAVVAACELAPSFAWTTLDLVTNHEVVLVVADGKFPVAERFSAI